MTYILLQTTLTFKGCMPRVQSKSFAFSLFMNNLESHLENNTLGLSQLIAMCRLWLLIIDDHSVLLADLEKVLPNSFNNIENTKNTHF